MKDSPFSTLHSQLPKGYKQTEVGVIPEDWETTALESITDPKRPISYGIVQTGSQILNGVRCLRVLDINDGKINRLDLITTSQEISNSYKRTILKIDDLVMPLRGKVGDVGIIDENLVGSNLTRGVALIALQQSFDCKYIQHYISSAHSRVRLESSLNGSALQELPIATLRKFRVAFPPTIAEQNLIARSLSDTDALIESLEQLLTKKRQIKQGAMQELLCPKEGWKDYLFPEICWFQEGPGVRNYQFTNSGVKLFNGTNIEKGMIDLEKTNRYISEKEAFGWYSHFMADEGDIVIACSGISIEKFEEKVSVIEMQHLPLCMNTSTMRFKVYSEQLDQSYLMHFLRSNVFKQQIGGKATGSAQLNFGPSHVSVVQIKLPGLSDQQAIATILSDMDIEIGAIETKLTKTRQLKQGMMHELLTGRIRLIDKG